MIILLIVILQVGRHPGLVWLPSLVFGLISALSSLLLLLLPDMSESTLIHTIAKAENKSETVQ